ncbi:MAG TPA: helix-turn-helix transcriptional regulator [Ktedonobacteraceae bacterium]|jgi:tetratricopeptide (TPR) repeat protein|nr:helix-turn-helix transcriptional regulator [Ktedonobacteraceae bacterium]
MSPEQSSSKIGKSVGEKLRAARLAQHYTQSQLAAPDFSVSYISAIERGQIHPSLRALEILAVRLGLSSTQLLPTRAQSDDRTITSINSTERDDEEVELALLDAELLTRQGEAQQAIDQLSKLSTKRLKKQQQLLHRYLLGWAYYRVQQFQECEYMLSEASLLAKELNDVYLNLRILNLLALSYAALRNYTQALLSHQRCLNQLESSEPHDPFFTAQVYMHMGQHYTQLENYPQAMEMFHHALDIVKELTTPNQILAVYWNLGQQYSVNKNFDLATIYAYKGLQFTLQQQHKRQRSELYHYLGYAIMKGDQQEARTYLDEALRKEESGNQDPLTLASLYTRNAEWYFRQHILQEAHHYATLARERANSSEPNIIGAEAHLILGRVEYALQHYDDGDRNFVDGLEMLERIGNHEELADEAVHYAQLLEEIGKDREAFIYFRRAFQSQQRLGK